MRHFLASAVMALAAASTAPTAGANASDRLAADLSNLIESAVAAAPAPLGAMLRVEAPSIGFVWTKAAGQSNRSTGEPLRPEQTLRIASNTKTYVAAATLRLVEDGRLGLDAALDDHLLPASIATLKKGGYDTRAITVRMLLQHTSGLFDYAATEQYLQRIVADPQQRWTRAEQLALGVAGGPPYGAAGETFHYSDTGYILLGEILETSTGAPMHKAVRDLLNFRGLGLASTWFDSLDPPPPGGAPRVHQYLGAIDTHGFDASIDLFGGGGLISNLQDLARFYRALGRGEVFKRRDTLDAMLAPSPQSLENPQGAGYGMGIGRVDIDATICYGHGGFWGTLARYCPAIDLTVTAAATSTSQRAALADITRHAIRLSAAAIAEQTRTKARLHQ